MPDRPEHADPEAAYRRGFQHGAFAAVDALARDVANEPALSALRRWAEVTLYEWRYHRDVENRDLRPPAPPRLRN